METGKVYRVDGDKWALKPHAERQLQDRLEADSAELRHKLECELEVKRTLEQLAIWCAPRSPHPTTPPLQVRTSGKVCDPLKS